jgi:hypothetical protein
LAETFTFLFFQEIEHLHDQLKEERERFERLEEQMNDLTELHQVFDIRQ